MWRFVVALLAACNVSPDVVARAVDEAGAPSTDKANDPGKPMPPACGAGGAVAVATKSGAIAWFDRKTLQRRAGAQCPGTGAPVIAMDRSGAVWTVSEGMLAIVERDGGCKRLDAPLEATAMTFGWDPDLATEILYALVDQVLVAIHPRSLARTPLGKLPLEDVRGLAGTGDGTLVAFAGERPVTIALVARSSGAVEKAWQLKPPGAGGSPQEEGRFAGGVLTDHGIELIFGQNLYAHDPKTFDLTFEASLPPDLDVFVASAPPCAPWEK